MILVETTNPALADQNERLIVRLGNENGHKSTKEFWGLLVSAKRPKKRKRKEASPEVKETDGLSVIKETQDEDNHTQSN